MKESEATSKIITAKAPTIKEKLAIRFLVFLGVVTLTIFLFWFFGKPRLNNGWLYWPLTIALLYKLTTMLVEWYHYIDISVPEKPELKRDYTVDILTTYCAGEPKEMIRNTLLAMKKITYPHTNYLCDEADDPELKKFCEDHGIVHVTRKEKVNAKAGNINNALKQATGELCVILDPDHIPIPEFLDRTISYFQDEKVGYVQCVQAYYNHKESLVAMGAAEQTYHYYGPMMMCMNSYNTVQAIGANCTFRRSALDSIGGHAPGLSEDMHTAMLLHSKGWKSVYVPEVLTKGLVPASLAAYYKQQLKWSRGTFDLLFYTVPKILKNFTWRQKLHYMSGPLYFLHGVVDFLNILIPVLALILNQFPWNVDLSEFARHYIPLVIVTLLIRMYAQRWLMEKHERGFHIVGGLLRIGTWWIFSLGFIYTIFKIKVPYIPTPKDDSPENNISLSLPNIIACIISIAAIAYGITLDDTPYTVFMAGFAMMNVIILGCAVMMGQQKLLVSFYNGVKSVGIFNTVIMPARKVFWKMRHGFYFVIRNESLVLTLVTVCVLLNFVIRDSDLFPIYNTQEVYYSSVSAPRTMRRELVFTAQSENIDLLKKENLNSFQLQINGKPFTIKGVGYTEGQDLTEEHLPLLRKKVEEDLDAIKMMGANTILRMNPGIYDKNLLKVAREKEIRIVFGFDLDPSIDYSADTASMKKEFLKIKSVIQNYKSNNSIIAWCIGNETWNNISEHYPLESVAKVQEGYIRYLQYVINYIHLIDPGKPVITIVRNDYTLETCLSNYSMYANSVDIIGVNTWDDSYYKTLPALMTRYFPHKPYMLTGFSWTPANVTSDNEKGKSYFWNYVKNVTMQQEQCIGGIAFCWQDKPGYEPAYGVIDEHGRKKASYYALKKLWSDEKEGFTFPEMYIIANKIGNKGQMQEAELWMDNENASLDYKWYIYRTDREGKYEVFRSLGSGKKIQFKLPFNFQDYKLMLIAENEEGDINILNKSLKID